MESAFGWRYEGYRAEARDGRTERSGGVASWEERLTRISAEITGVKRAAVAYVSCYVLCYVIYRLSILIPMLIAVNL